MPVHHQGHQATRMRRPTQLTSLHGGDVPEPDVMPTADQRAFTMGHWSAKAGTETTARRAMVSVVPLMSSPGLQSRRRVRSGRSGRPLGGRTPTSTPQAADAQRSPALCLSSELAPCISFAGVAPAAQVSPLYLSSRPSRAVGGAGNARFHVGAAPSLVRCPRRWVAGGGLQTRSRRLVPPSTSPTSPSPPPSIAPTRHRAVTQVGPSDPELSASEISP